MARKPTYEELEQKVRHLESELPKYKEQKEASEQKMLENFRGLAERSQDAIYHYDLISQEFLFVNKIALELYGLKEEDKRVPTTKSVLLHIYPEDREKVQKAQRDSIASGCKGGEVEYRFLHADGTIHWMNDRWNVIRDESGKPIAIEGIVRDDTERKRAEGLMRVQRDLALRLSGERSLDEGLRLCFDAALRVSGMDCGGVYLFDNISEDLELVFHKGLPKDFVKRASHFESDSANTKLVMMGKPTYTQHQRLGVPLDDVEKSEDLKAVAVLPISHQDQIIGCLNIASHTIDEVPVFSRVALETIASQIGNAIIHLKTEEALRESEERFRLAFENANIGICLVGLNGRLTRVNSQMCEIFGYNKEELESKTVNDIAHPEDLEVSPMFIQRATSGDIEHIQFEKRYIHKRGHIVWGQVSSSIVRDFQGEPIYFISHVQDITERKRAEEALKKSESKYRSLVESIPQKIFLKDQHLVYLSCNRSYAEDLAIDPEEISGKDDFMFYPRELAEKYRADDKRIMGAGKTETFEEKYLIKGEERWVRTTKMPLSREDGETYAIFGIFEDITERKRMEEELLRSQKLESVGLLAGGIAHDFNNILTTIIGNVSMAKTQVAPEDEIFDLLNEAEMASTRAQKLTKQLLTFAKGGAPLKETASIKDILKESCSFVLRGSKSICEFSIAEDLCPAEVDVGQMSQVINNIVINANQAMPEGGIIQVAAENLIIEDRHGLPVKPGRYIRISVIDQGVGIAEKHLTNIFDPYFTTKQEGSGLGLATTYSIIKKHEGCITVESRLGIGTTFHIYLPASEKAVPEKEEAQLIKGQGRILVMDDQAPLRKMVGRMLGNLGYEPEFAKDGDEALRMYKDAQESEKPYDAVILDLTIPGGMGGKEAINKLLEIDPEVKAIVSSGYSDDPVLSNFQEYGFKGMMPKPFESRSLGKVLHEVLKGEKLNIEE